MSFEKYIKLYEDYAEGTTVRVGGKPAVFTFKLDGEKTKKYRLFVTGETGLFYQWKNEPDNPTLYRSLTDALDQKNAYKATYALKLSSKKNEDYVRRVIKKILWTPKLAYINMNPTPETWDFGLYVKTKDLKIAKDGYLRMRLDVRHEKDGVSREFNILPADESYIINISEGDTEWTRLSSAVRIPKSVASVSVFIEGVRYSGEVFVERPFIISPEEPEKNILPDFSVPAGREYFEWNAQYLSRKEWPEFRVTLNGKKIFEGERFERCHRFSEWEIDLPRELLNGKNNLEIELISDYHDPLPYTFAELGITEAPGGKFALVAASSVAPAFSSAHALIRTECDNVRVFASYSEKLDGEKEFYFEKAGLHGISFSTKEASQNASFELYDGSSSVSGTISRIVLKDDDLVYTGTGDMIYVEQKQDAAEEYLSWYLSAGIGNMLTIRPNYRWSGTRVLSREVFKTVTRILNEWDIKYPHMLDGRELPGLNANPDEKMLAGKGFLGQQMHERDGACFYWRRYDCPRGQTAMQHRDLYFETFREDPEHSNPHDSDQKYVFPNSSKDKKALSTAPTFDGDAVDSDTYYIHKNPNSPRDMKYAYEESVERISKERMGRKRHSGPSVMFKYMLDGGYSWVSAETMYGTMEPIMAFLRGATKERGIESRGVHHALQWSSSPEDAPEHVRRYRLALYVSYMQGATEINTEEGLWRLEEYYSHFHRFSDACIEHAKQQQDFYKYVSTHTRRGKFYTPMGLIHGRYDGRHGFGRNSTWGWKNVVDTDAEKSWDLLSVFYPEQNLGDALYFHNFPSDKPLGFYSSTPIGNVDTVPIEQRRDTYSDYRALAFMGYNMACENDLEKLEKFVKDGGKLLLTRAHLTETTDYKAILEGRLSYFDTPLGFTDGAPVFESKTVNGAVLSVAKNTKTPDRVLAECDDGTPLVSVYKLGDGEVTLFNASAYPANPAIRALYERELKRHAEYAWESEHVKALCGDGTEAAIFKRDGGESDVYFLAVDWYRDEKLTRHARLLIGEAEHEIPLSFGTMTKASVCDAYAAYPHSEDGEVISVKGGFALLQGSGKISFTLINGKSSREVEIDFSEAAVQLIKI